MAEYFKLWGKTTSDGSAYPLILHMLDCAAVSNEWLTHDNKLLEIFTLNSGLSGNKNDLIVLFSWIIALHDIGKATVCFQNKIPELAKDAGIYKEISM